MLDPQVASLLTQLGYDPATVESMIDAVLWLTVAALVAVVPTGMMARKRGRSVTLWVILALSIPVLPLFIVWLLSDKRTEQADKR